MSLGKILQGLLNKTQGDIVSKTSLVSNFFGAQKPSPAEVVKLTEEERKKRALSFFGADDFGYPYPGDDAPNILIPEPLVDSPTTFVPQTTEVPQIIEAPRGQIVKGLANIILEIERINRNITNIQTALANSSAIEAKYREQIIKDKRGQIAERDKLRSQRRASRRRESVFGRMMSPVREAMKPVTEGGKSLITGLLQSTLMAFAGGIANAFKKATTPDPNLGLPPSGGGKLPNLPPTNTVPGQQYGDPRDDDGDGIPDRQHAGTDFDIQGNDEFYSRIGGVVTKVGTAQGYGNYVDIYNQQFDVTERIAEGRDVLVKEGDTVQPGTPIVRGETQTGVIHYEIRSGNVPGQYGFTNTRDPLEFLRSVTPPPPPDPAPPQAPDPAGRQSSAPGTPLSSDIAAAPVMPSVAPSSRPALDLGPVARAPVVIDARVEKKLNAPQMQSGVPITDDVASIEPRLTNSGYESMFAV
jgi:murein DD-endopeptidase MepM/ murein hydrolase activator NlpD